MTFTLDQDLARFPLGLIHDHLPPEVPDLAVFAEKPIPIPPVGVALPEAKGGWPMALNDTYGDCTIAGVAHLLAAWDAESNETDAVPDGATMAA